jgi:hypothetical protein
MEYYTYAYLRNDGTPYYIGKGKCGSQRHLHKGHNVHLPPNNRILILKSNITEEEAFRHEIYMIAVFGRKDLGTGILRNLTDGGEGRSGYTMSQETKEKLRQKNVGKRRKPEQIEKHRKFMTGRKLTEEHKKNIGNGGRGRKMSEETIERMKIAAKERGNNRSGTRHSEETKEKMRKSAKERWERKRQSGK